jgi:hypothetical protein
MTQEQQGSAGMTAKKPTLPAIPRAQVLAWYDRNDADMNTWPPEKMAAAVEKVAAIRQEIAALEATHAAD